MGQQEVREVLEKAGWLSTKKIVIKINKRKGHNTSLSCVQHALKVMHRWGEINRRYNKDRKQTDSIYEWRLE